MSGLLKQTGLLKARTLAKSAGGSGAALTYAATPVAAGAAAGASAGKLACTLLGAVAFSVLAGALAVNSASGALTTTATAAASGTIAGKVRAQTSTDAVETTIAVPIQAVPVGPTPQITDPTGTFLSMTRSAAASAAPALAALI